jgi:2'-5' RNA ligase
LANPVSQRLFFALWPEPETAQAIWRAAATLVPKGVGRRLPPEHIHLTLAFLGSIEDARQDCVIQAAQDIQAEAFTLQLDEAGHFPRPQVVWVGTRQMPSALKTLQTKLVSELMRQCGFEPETRPFVPHITLWRKVRRVDLPESLDSVSWPVSRFVLARSRTLPTGAEYSIVREWPLAAAAMG